MLPWRAIAEALAGALFSAAIAAAQADPVATPPPAARVNGVAIERTAVQALVKGLARAEATPPDSARITQLTDAALESLIDLELLYQEAVRRNVALAPGEVDSEVAKVRRLFSDDAAFAEALRQRGLTPELLRLDTRRTLMAERLLESTAWREVRVDSQEVENFYEENRAALSQPLAELRDSIAEMLLADKRASLRAEFIAGLRKGAAIHFFPPYGAAPAPAAD